jgi:hypothetical protein
LDILLRAEHVDNVFCKVGFASGGIPMNPEFGFVAVSPTLELVPVLDPDAGIFSRIFIGRVLVEFVGAERAE